MEVSRTSRASIDEPGRRPAAVTMRIVDRGETRRSRGWHATRFLGALSLLAVGAVHLQQYDYLYSTIPTIGTLFLLNFAGATVIGLGLLAPVGLLGSFLLARLTQRAPQGRW